MAQPRPVHRMNKKKLLPNSFAFMLFISVLTPLSALPLHAASTIGIPGGPVFDIEASSDSENAVYTATGSGVFKSVHRKDIWSPANEGLGSTFIYDIAIDPVTRTILYCATKQGVYKTTDGGTQWSSAGLDDYQTYCLTISPITKTWIAAGTTDGVFTSTDSGGSWTQQPSGPLYVYTLAVSPNTETAQTLYAGSFSEGIYKSTDFASTWSAAGTGPEYVHHLAIGPSQADTLYAGSTRGIYKTTSGGTQWSKLTTDFSGVAVYDADINPDDSSILYAATDKGVYKSTSGGRSWFAANSGIERQAEEGPFVRAVAIDPGTVSIVYAGIYSGDSSDADIYTSTNGGTSWEQINRELANTTVRCLAYDREDPDIMYAGTGSVGILKSMNRGLSWQEANSGITTYTIQDIAVNPSSSKVYAGTTSGLFISASGGESWALTSPNHEIYSITVDPVENQTVYIGTNRGIFLSTDDGATWSSINNNLINPYIYCTAINPDDTTALYVGTRGDGIFKSTSGGSTWEETAEATRTKQINTLAIDPVFADTVYAGAADDGIYQTIDGADTWQKVFPDNGTRTVESLAVHPVDTDIVYAGLRNHGLVKSTDAGYTWVQAGDNMTEKTIYDILIDNDTPQTIYAAIQGDIAILTFNTPPGTPFAPTPADGAVLQPLTATLSWSCSDPDPTDSISYRVYFGTDNSTDNSSYVSTSEQTYNPGTLQRNQTYFWKITAIDSIGAKTAGPVWSFTTLKSRPPYEPGNPSPADGARRQPLTPELSWTGGDPDDNDTLSYTLYLGINNPPEVKIKTLTASSYTIQSPLRRATTYYWKIIAQDSRGVETEGPVWNFSTGLGCFVEQIGGADQALTPILRSIRDNLLMKTESGRALVGSYYRLSACAVRISRRNPSLRARTQNFIASMSSHARKALQTRSISPLAPLLPDGFCLLDAYISRASSQNKALFGELRNRIRPYLESETRSQH